MRAHEPRTNREREITLLVEVLRSVVPARCAIYVSAPLTSGRRFSEWYAQVASSLPMTHTEFRNAHIEAVVGPNRADAREAVQRMRRESVSGVLIDPTAVPDFPEWTQDDYRVLWARVIEEYARSVVFLEGWHYSSGCTYEFLTASRRGIRTLREDGQILSVQQAEDLIGSAIQEMCKRGVDTGFAEWALGELRGLGTRHVQDRNPLAATLGRANPEECGNDAPKE